MKIPQSIRIGGVEFTVNREYRLNDGKEMLAGQIRYMDCQIAIAEDSSHEYQCLSLWHEIMHGIEQNAQLRKERDAAVADLTDIMFVGGAHIDTCQFCKTDNCYNRGGQCLCCPEWRGVQENVEQKEKMEC